ncbi:MAG TPA: YjjG family noncanonical pyrimidine nucleotidase [Chryseolinea sp.]|nr:YjjG family noncanonical pyrimidine nucleotidase [Chryseolinea sp.]
MSEPQPNGHSNTNKYSTIFFDLDHTLWDYETNSQETLIELYGSYSLQSKGIADLNLFQTEFRKVNTELWLLYDQGFIGSDVIRKERFKQILRHFYVFDEKLSQDLSRDYLEICPRKGHLMPHAIEVLTYLSGRYRLTVITNGFEEIQNLKLSAGNLHQFFDHIITSQKAGHRKPSKEIFDWALSKNSIPCHQAIMVGDNLIADISGARNANIDNVFYNAEKITHASTPDFEIFSLTELRGFL